MNAAGIFTLDAATYHADPCPEPSLSSSIARLIIDKTPAHAEAAHPRLTENIEQRDTDSMDIGTIVHAVILEGDGTGIDLLDYPDFRTNAAKEARDASRAAGRIPVLARKWEDIDRVCAAAAERLDDHQADPRLFAGGKSEQTIIWQEGNVWCRSRVDWLRDDYTIIDDLKTTGKTADPYYLARHIYSMGYDIQAAFYQRGIEALTGVRPDFRFVFVETEPPYGLSVVELSPAGLALAHEKVGFAIERWGQCLTVGKWPCYSTRVATIDPPAWAESAWLERDYKEVGA